MIRARAPVALGLLLVLGTLVAAVSACTTEIVTAVPETVEEPASEDPASEEPDSDEDSDSGDDPDDDGSDGDGDSDDDDSDGDDDDGDDEEDDDDGDDDGDDDDDDDGDDDSDGGDEPDPNGEEVHGIPTGQMPRPGSCRIWDPDLSAGRQSPPGDCEELRGRLPPGSWLLFRPNAEPRVYRIA